MSIKVWSRKFLKEEGGAATIEALLWLPAFVVFFVMIADVSFVFHRQSQVLRIVQDANRSLSVGRFSSEIETEDYIKETLQPLSTSLTVETDIDDGVATTDVLIPVGDLVAVGMFNFLSGYNIRVRTQHFVEF